MPVPPPRPQPANRVLGATVAVGTRAQTYLIAKNDAISPAGLGPLDFDWVIEQLQKDPVVDVIKTLTPRSLTLQAFGPSVLSTVVVAAMPEQTADELAGHPQILLEPDHLVYPLPAPEPPPPPADDPFLVSPFGTQAQWQLRLQSEAGDPVEGATVYLYGHGIPTQGKTDAQGMVTLSLFNESDATLQALYVNPLSGYWSQWINRPALTSGLVNAVTLHALSDSFPGFPQRQMYGWGQLAMRLDQVPADRLGQGIKVGVIDSGAAALTHPDLAAIRSGGDFAGTTPEGPDWTVDVIAHGSHCSGVIAGANDVAGIRGFAPAAEVHEARIFPGGSLASLMDALDYCIDQRLDVVNMSLGTGGSSQAFLQKLAQAREQGVACIVAAGNSGDGVQFPGVSPDVMTVAAVGQEGTFPADSYHAQQRWKQGHPDQNLFAAQFSCHGPEIDVCGPGVAIVSSVPPDAYASWDGTSMATPHITGLAALVLAHHPDFQTPGLRLPTAARVDRLFQILKDSCRPLDVGDPDRVGSGLPDAVRALGLEGVPAADVSSRAAAAQASIQAALAQLRLDLVAAGLMAEVASVGPTVVAPPTDTDLQRDLTALRAQMSAAGLLPDRAAARETVGAAL